MLKYLKLFIWILLSCMPILCNTYFMYHLMQDANIDDKSESRLYIGNLDLRITEWDLLTSHKTWLCVFVVCFMHILSYLFFHFLFNAFQSFFAQNVFALWKDNFWGFLMAHTWPKTRGATRLCFHPV